MDREKIQRFNQCLPNESYNLLFGALDRKSLTQENRDTVSNLLNYFENPINVVQNRLLRKKFSSFHETVRNISLFHVRYFFRPDVHAGLHPISRFRFPMNDGSGRTHDQFRELEQVFDRYVDQYEQNYIELIECSRSLGHL